MTSTIDATLVKSLFPSRSALGNKGDFGSALLIAGSQHYTGAALLAGRACLRSGPGLVFMGIPSCLHMPLSAALPEAIWEILPSEDGALSEGAAEVLASLFHEKSALLIGPGLGQLSGTRLFFKKLFYQVLPQSNTSLKVLFDADALNLLAGLPGWASQLPQQVILTPHHREMSRLTNLSVEEIADAPVEIAVRSAERWQAIVVLKGAATVIAGPDREARILTQPTSALAHGGTGDVLAGMITGLLAQGISPFDAATIGVFVHNLSAGIAQKTIGWAGSVLPGDLIRQLGQAYATVSPD